MNKTLAWKLVVILSIIGIFLALYLLVEYYAISTSDLCYINEKYNCGVVTKGSLSTIVGVPVALVGLIGYAFILFSSITKRKKLMLGMSTFGMLFCLRITILELFFIKIMCPVCLACQIVMILVFILSLYLNYSKAPKK